MAMLYLFDDAKFYKLTQVQKNFIPPPDCPITKDIIPSPYVNQNQLNLVRTVCRSYPYDYILCPFYREQDYQLLVTGKMIRNVDQNNFFNAIKRETYEELGLYPRYSKNEGRDESSIDVADCRVTTNSDHLYDVYNKYESLSYEEFVKNEKSQLNHRRVKIVVHGKYQDIVDKYEDVNIIRPKFAESNIIGYVMIPARDVLAKLV